MTDETSEAYRRGIRDGLMMASRLAAGVPASAVEIPVVREIRARIETEAERRANEEKAGDAG
jgi:hypothetical protein